MPIIDVSDVSYALPGGWHGGRRYPRPMVMRLMDRFLSFEQDGSVRELLRSPYPVE